MKKNLLYTAIGLMGLMGTLTIGVVNAEITITHYTGSNISYTLNGNELFTGLGTITIRDGTDIITILDRNLGAKKAGTGCEDPSRGSACAGGDDTYGYHFQRGNNYGFDPLDTSIEENAKPVSSDGVVWSGIYDNSGYYGTTFIKGDSSHGYDYWGDSTSSSSNHENLRGGGGDYNDTNNGFGKNNENRRGPCPEGFHVPSYGELQKLQSMLNADGKRTKDILRDELLIPFAGSRSYYAASVFNMGYTAGLWSSSPLSVSDPGSRYLDLSVDGGLSMYDSSRANATSVRCFYDSYQPFTQSFILSFMGSEGGSISTGSIEAEEGSSISRDDEAGTVSISGTVVATGIADEGYVFSGWTTDCGGDTVTTGCSFTGVFKLETYMITYELNGGTNSENNLTGYTIKDSITFANPTKEGFTFDGWFTDAQFTTGITSISTGTTGPITVYAKWTENKKSSGSSGGGGRSSKTSDTQDSSTSSQNDKNTENVIQSDPEHSERGSEESSKTPMDSSDKSSEGQNQQQFTPEFISAYEFAKEKGITTMPTINEANMNGKLTRIAMAKMLSYYAINVLGQEPDETRNNKFNDISDQLDAQYDSGVTLAYQLGIMGINMPDNKFRPNDEVTRGEFGTALSRMIYKIADGKDKYYSTHLAKLMEEGIITNDNPKMKELRGYVMIMLMRSAK